MHTVLTQHSQAAHSGTLSFRTSKTLKVQDIHQDIFQLADLASSLQQKCTKNKVLKNLWNWRAEILWWLAYLCIFLASTYAITF